MGKAVRSTCLDPAEIDQKLKTTCALMKVLRQVSPGSTSTVSSLKALEEVNYALISMVLVAWMPRSARQATAWIFCRSAAWRSFRPQIENLLKMHLASSLLVSEMKALRPSVATKRQTPRRCRGDVASRLGRLLRGACIFVEEQAELNLRKESFHATAGSC